VQVEFQVEGADTEKAPRGKVASNVGWSGKEICIERTQEDSQTSSDR